MFKLHFQSKLLNHLVISVIAVYEIITVFVKSALTIWLFPQWIQSIACLVYRAITSKFVSYFLTSWVFNQCVNILRARDRVFLQVEIELSQNLPWEDIWGQVVHEVCSMWWWLSDLWCLWMLPVWGRLLPVRLDVFHMPACIGVQVSCLYCMCATSVWKSLWGILMYLP